MQTVKKKFSELRETDKNIRKHSDHQIAEYIKSLEMFGQMRPLVVTDDGEILVGNGMFKAMSRMGWEEADAYVMTGLTKTQKRKLMLADNKVYELGSTSLDDFEDILKDLGGDFDIPGYDSDLLSSIMSPVEEEILGYGTQEPSVTEPSKDETVEFHSVGQAQYAPPQKDEYGGFVDPNAPAPAPTPIMRNDIPTAPAQQERYIICPHCGEKICL